MYYWPKEDPKYDHSKSRAENYRNLRKLFERDSSIKTIEQWSVECRSMLKNERYYKGAHLDWNYTEMLRDLIDQGVVKVPITDFEVLFVEWASGNLDSLSPHTKIDQALYNWNDDEKDPAIRLKLRMDNDECFPWDEIHKATELCCYNDSNREEFTPSPAETTPVVPAVSSPATVESSAETVEPKQFLNGADALQSTVQQPTPVQYGGNQYIVPAHQQHQSWVPNVDYVDPNFIPEWERKLMEKEAMMGTHGREILRQMGMIPQYQPPQYQTMPNIPQQSMRFTSPEQVVSYIIGNEPNPIYNNVEDEQINNALEGTFIGSDD